nr:hypothetical protein [Tanacetum cinerariifolium]
MPSPPRQSSPSPIPFGPAPSSSGIATLKAKLKATKMLHRGKVVLFAKQIKKLESKLKTKKRKLVLSDSENEDEARQAAKIIYKRLKKQQSSSGLDFTDAVIPAVGRVSAGGADPAVIISAGGADPADVVVSTGGADSAGTVDSAGPSVPSAPSSPIRDPAKGKVIATPSSHVTAPSDKELADQQAAIFEAE